MIADASYRVIERFQSRDDLWPDFHEYLLTADGTAFVVSYDPVPANLASVGGARRGRAYDCVIQEISIPSGRVLFEWRSLDHVRITESYETPRRNHPYDYFHVNSVGFDSDGHLLVCARNTWAIYKIHRRTGRVIWRLGGKRSDFAMGSGTRFAFQHDARSRANGRVISLFDNGPVPNADRESRALMLALDEKRMRATLARQIRHTPPLFARITGNAQVLGNGNVLVCWGNTGYFTEYGDDNRPRFDARLPRGGQNYRVYRSPWSGRPAARPRIAARAASGGTRLYASWNGATEVAEWEVLAGHERGQLAPVQTAPRDGFETAVVVETDAHYVAVRALADDGRVLGTSPAVEATG